MFRFSKAIALMVFEALYWFFPNIFNGFFDGFEEGIAIAAVIIGCTALGFLAGKNIFIFKEETIEKNARMFVWVFLIYFFILGFIFLIVSLNLFSFNGLQNDFPVPGFLPLFAVVSILASIWLLFQIFNGFLGLAIAPFLIGFYLKKALQASSLKQ